MRISVLQIDKTQEAYLDEGIELYARRLKGYVSVEMITINVPKNLRQRSIAEQKSEEGKLILNKVNKEDYLVLLDEKGKQLDSQSFAKFISSRQNASTKH